MPARRDVPHHCSGTAQNEGIKARIPYRPSAPAIVTGACLAELEAGGKVWMADRIQKRAPRR